MLREKGVKAETSDASMTRHGKVGLDGGPMGTPRSSRLLLRLDFPHIFWEMLNF
jgi:hypothetical protein